MATRAIDAQDRVTDHDQAKDMETVVVKGTVPGPSMWRVSNGAHTLYILATITPLPSDMTWKTDDIDAVIASSDEVIAPPAAKAKISVGDAFKIATLAKSAYSSMRLPHGKTLRDVLPADLFARWRDLKQKYAATDEKIERSRPIFAAEALFSSAIGTSGMTQSSTVWAHVLERAEAGRVPVASTTVSFPLEIDRQQYKAGIRTIATSEVDGEGCFAHTLDTLEADLETMKQAANAWAVGDLEQLQLLDHGQRQTGCKAEYDQMMGFQSRTTVDEQARDAWLTTAQAALGKNRTTLAVLPISDLVGASGLLSKLQANGYQVTMPADADINP